MKTGPNLFVLMPLIGLAAFASGSLIRVYQLDTPSSILIGLAGGMVAVWVEREARRLWPSLGRHAVKPREDGFWRWEDTAMPDFLTLMLLIVSIGPAIGLAGAVIAHFYGLRGTAGLPVNFAVMVATGAFIVGLVRLIRHIVRLELDRARHAPALSDDRPIAAPHK